MKKELIVALDFPNLLDTKKFLEQFGDEPIFVKVGMELFYQEGPAVISYLKEQGHSIFLDLKLHDIPNTVKSAMRRLASLGVDIVNVHAAGGTKMMESALEGLEAGAPSGKKRPVCIGVTQLTSTSEEVMRNEIWINQSLDEVVVYYAKLASASGLDGVVCSSLEVPFIHKACGEDFVTVTPGIRLPNDESSDQTRIVTPEKARELGSTAIVVGRSITRANEPLQIYQQIKALWEGVIA
ncbi:orotidine-5'-phosphate decarboxylase [Fredinandcohnia quinoae]|uniref:Orotidine 5'-phosphate decarboxylase n=1 Tax=Fredinandcohnia quinoae TaxID=2918902 RepID=A0AAW5E4Y8_9BACI|nr:orotidine-5'-phosphate decarboxylase [Fredinandcohnia sp. SECRCQ15]MCH1623844.1 orotidine-5'-phosphate decarboxylase [Fredinandcohnia sp. SECRCQ15]